MNITADDTILSNVDVAADSGRLDHTTLLDCHVMADFHGHILQLFVLLDEGWADDHVLLDDHICSKEDRCHITSDKDLGMHDILTFHLDILKSFENNRFGDLVVLLSEQVELGLVVFWNDFHL